MRRIFLLGVIACFGCSLFLSAGCTKKSASANDAIQNSASLKTVKEKADYLMGQANAFYNSKEFQQAIQTAQYVLNNFDQNSQAAKNLIEKAKSRLQSSAQKAVGDVGNKLFGK